MAQAKRLSERKGGVARLERGFTVKAVGRIVFAKGKWTRTGPDANGCFTYEAKEEGANGSVRDADGGAETFKAKKKGAKIILCGSTAHFDEDIELTDI